MPRRLPVDELRPTQLYLSSEKLTAVTDWFDLGSPTYEPLLGFKYDGEWYLSDGYTRAFVAWLVGGERVRVEPDPEGRAAYDFDVYRTCIEWCREAGVETVPDLRGARRRPGDLRATVDRPL
jgi:hypothetical protein